MLHELKKIEKKEKALAKAVKLLHTLELKVSKKLIDVLIDQVVPINVTTLQVRIREDQGVTSGHLTKLHKLGILELDTQGTFHYYKLTNKYFDIVPAIIKLASFYSDAKVYNTKRNVQAKTLSTRSS